MRGASSARPVSVVGFLFNLEDVKMEGTNLFDRCTFRVIRGL